MAKSRSIGGIYASLSLRDQGFKAGLKNAKKSLAEFGAKAAMAAGGGAVAAGTALAAGARRTLSMTDDLGDISNQTGVAVSDMMELQQAYAMGGRAAEMAGKDIAKMQRSLVTASAGGANPFEKLGLNAADLLQMDPADQFKKIGAAIMAMSNPAERTAAAMEIFGKGSMGLTTVFEGIPDAVTALGKMPEIAEEFAGRMGEANDLIGNLPLKSDQFFMGFTAGIVDQLIPALNDINEFDFTMIGKSLGDSLTEGLKEAGIILNTFWDVVTGQDSKGAGGGNKYAEAQMAIDLERQLATAQAKADKINDQKTKSRLEFQPEDFMVDEAAMKAIEDRFNQRIAMDEIWNEELPAQAATAQRSVNAYQSKGWSLDGNGAGRAVETTNSLLGKIKDILADAKKTGGLKF